MTCVSLNACRREKHPHASCAHCGVITCRYALDADGRCWKCELVPAWAQRPGTAEPTAVPGELRRVVVRGAWGEVSLVMGERPLTRRAAPVGDVKRAEGRSLQQAGSRPRRTGT